METNKSKTGIDIELDYPTLECVYEKLKEQLNSLLSEFDESRVNEWLEFDESRINNEELFNKPIEFITIDKEVDNESLNSNGIGQTNYVLKIRFL